MYKVPLDSESLDSDKDKDLNNASSRNLHSP